MAVKGCYKAMKWILIVFNALILCGGAIAIGLGSWGLASEYGAEKLEHLTGSEFYRGAAIAIIVGGCVMVVIALLGFLGAFLENRVLLGIYFVIMLLLLILFVVASAVAFAYRDSLEKEILKQMNNTLLYDYGHDSDVTNVWDDLQKKLQCCGVKGREARSSDSWFAWQRSDWFKTQMNTTKKYVPESCCNTNFKDIAKCTSLNSDMHSPVQTSYHNVTSDNPYLYIKGCYDRLREEIREHVLAIAGIAVAIVIVMFLSLLFAICVCSNIGRKKMVV